MVAFIVSGYVVSLGNVAPYTEIYSPNGGCSHQLASLPFGLWDFGLVLFGNTILACGGNDPSGSPNRNCWRYDISSDKWILHSTLINGHHQNTPYLPYNNKIYCVDYSNGEAFSNATNLWSLDLTAPGYTQYGECSVRYNDSIYIMGGNANVKYVQKFNFTTGQWSFPFTLNNGVYFSSCLLLPKSNGKVLILSIVSGVAKAQTATIVDLETNQQTAIPTPTYYRAWGNNLVALGNRIFSVNGWDDTSNIAVAEEYHLGNNSWSQISAPLIYPRHRAGALSVHASWFSKLPGGCTGVL
jgi:hypothetical protein